MFGSIKLAAGILLASAVAFAAPGDPVAIIKKKDAELQKMLRDKGASKNTDRLKVLINGIFDFEELGKREAKRGDRGSAAQRFEAALGPTGAFPNARRARVLWLGLSIPGFLARWFEQATVLISGGSPL